MRAPRSIDLACLLTVPVLLFACVSAPEQPEGTETAARRDVEITIEGGADVSERALRRAAADALIVLEREGEEYQADDAAWDMEDYLRREGYHAARVDYEFDPGPPAGVVFRVFEGPRAVLGRIELEGRGDVPEEELLPFFRGSEALLLGGEAVFVRTHAEEAASSIRAWYRAQGYLEAAVGAPAVTFREEGTVADVRVVIRPGPRFVIDRIVFEGIDDFETGEALDVLESPIGRHYTAPWLARAEKRLIAHYRSRGHSETVVEGQAELDRETGAVTVTMDVSKGPVRMVGRIEFEGLKKTRGSFLRTLIDIEPGQIFDGEKVRRAQSAFYETALFHKVSVREEPVDDDRVDIDGNVDTDPCVDIVFIFEERMSRDIAFMVGYGSYEMLRGSATYTDRNLLGRGLHWSTSLKASFRNVRLKTSLTDPTFMRLPVAGTIEVDGEVREFPSFTESRYGAVASLARSWGRSFTTSAGYSIEKSETDDVHQELENLNIEESVTVGSLFVRGVLDLRDRRVQPRRGAYYEVKLEAAEDYLGGTESFNRFSARSSWLFALDADARWVLAFGARTGIIVRQGDTDEIPLQLRFFNGGPDSVRSFRFNELGPEIDGDPLGGEFFSTGNVELRAPLYGNLGCTFFADAGNVILRRTDVGLHDYRYALGVGVRYDLPIGPIRLDWGWNPNRRGEEELWALHFSAGFAF